VTTIPWGDLRSALSEGDPKGVRRAVLDLMWQPPEHYPVLAQYLEGKVRENPDLLLEWPMTFEGTPSPVWRPRGLVRSVERGTGETVQPLFLPAFQPLVHRSPGWDLWGWREVRKALQDAAQAVRAAVMEQHPPSEEEAAAYWQFQNRFHAYLGEWERLAEGAPPPGKNPRDGALFKIDALVRGLQPFDARGAVLGFSNAFKRSTLANPFTLSGLYYAYGVIHEHDLGFHLGNRYWTLREWELALARLYRQAWNLGQVEGPPLFPTPELRGAFSSLFWVES
jgi:hypothetical protein